MHKSRLTTGTRLIRTISMILILSFVCLLCSCAQNDNDFDGTRFAKTRKISVLSDSSDKALEQFIHDSVLRDCNIDVVFFPPKYYAQDFSMVPDVSYTEGYDKVTAFYRMNSVINISPYLDKYAGSLSDLKNMLGEENMYFCSDDHSEVWYLKSRRPEIDSRVTFIRKDWLEKLGLKAPSTRQELHDCLTAFRDNADKLLGEDASKIIPFFADSEPNVSCKPLFDSFYDPDADAMTIYQNGYCRATQKGYINGLKTLNEWYLEHLLPEDFSTIRPGTKESYEPIEKGYVGAFCAKFDYLYMNGENSHISALRKNRGEKADYIAVNTFENASGEYTHWQEDYLEEACRIIYMPSTCSDPLASLVYLNWISNLSNIAAMKDVASVKSSGKSTLDSYLITYQGHYPDEGAASDPALELAKQTALKVKKIHQGNKCLRYGAGYLSDTKYSSAYPGSTATYTCKAIRLPEGQFAGSIAQLYDEYSKCGAELIYSIRFDEWKKVVDDHNLEPR